MFSYQPSIRHKITLGYYAVAAIIIGVSIFTLIEMRFLEKKIIFGDVITQFFDATLEIRRFEKNYFLFENESDYRENLNYVNRAQELLGKHMEGFSAVSYLQPVTSLKEDLEDYKKLMDQYAALNRENEPSRRLQKKELEIKIRTKGKKIVTIAEDMSKTERMHLQRLLVYSQRFLIFSIIFLGILVIGIGQVLSRIVVRPLKLLEKGMEVIADGKFETIHIDSKDREIVSLTNAFTKMLKELELRQRHLVQAEKLASLGTLLSGVAHELNNPLSNISSSCQILIEEINDADIEYRGELLQQIEDQSDRARNIVRSLLEFSRNKEFSKDTLSLGTVLGETIGFIRGQIPAKVSITTSIPDNISIFADKQRVQQVFLNLIKNAIEAIGDEGSIVIEAQSHKAVDKIREDESEIYNYLRYHGKCTIEEDTVDIKISDTGSGIPAEVLPKVFDPFFTTKDVGKGSGLGLYIVHEIIEEHDGCIAVDSTPGKGTTFLIRLPLKK